MKNIPKGKLPFLLLIFAFLCYGITIVAFIMKFAMIAYLGFILQSISFLAYFFLCAAPSSSYTGDEDSGNTDNSPSEAEQIQSCNEALQARDKEIESLSLLLSAAQTQIKEQSQMQETLEKETSEKETSYNIILPPQHSKSKLNPIDIIQVANNTIQDMLPFAQKADIVLTLSSERDSLLVKAEESRLYLLFRNIIDNSIKYMNQSGSLVITISNIDSDIFIVCKDNGAGLSESETGHIFELNYQGSNRISGNGLGLTQAKAIVDSYGGTIYAKSNPNQGMAIYIQIPAERN